MIEINLLPESLRKVEGTPLPRLLATYIGIAICCGLVVVVLHFWRNVAPEYQTKLKALEERVRIKEADAGKLAELDDKIKVIRDHVDTVENLYRQRIIWSKLLWDLKQIVNHDPALNRINPDARYLWLSEIKLSKARGGRVRGGSGGPTEILELQGSASARDESEALRMVQEFMSAIQTYSSAKVPEEQERERLQSAIQKMEANRLKEMDETGEMPEKSKAQLEAEKKLAGLKDRKSGLVALRPFREFFETLSFEGSKWTKMSGAGKGADELQPPLPEGAHEFEITLGLKPPVEEEQTRGRGR